MPGTAPTEKPGGGQFSFAPAARGKASEAMGCRSSRPEEPKKLSDGNPPGPPPAPENVAEQPSTPEPVQALQKEPEEVQEQLLPGEALVEQAQDAADEGSKVDESEKKEETAGEVKAEEKPAVEDKAEPAAEEDKAAKAAAELAVAAEEVVAAEEAVAAEEVAAEEEVVEVKDFDMKQVRQELSWHDAASAGERHTLAWQLSEAGEDIESLLDRRDDEKRSALHLAARDGRKATCEWLLHKRSDACALSKTKATPLHFAALSGHLEIVQLLLEPERLGSDEEAFGKDWPDWTSVDLWKCTPLHRAAEGASPEVAMLLLSKKAEAYKPDREGNSPLHKATAAGCVPLVADLIKRPRVQLDATNGDGYSPLDLCVKHKLPEAGDEIFKAGGKLDKDVRKNPPTLLGAARAGLPFLCSYVLKKDSKTVKKLLSEADDEGRTPLLLAVRIGSSATVGRLLEGRAAELLAQKAPCGHGPWHEAAAAGHQAVAELLLENAAAIDGLDANGRTALFHASENGQISMLQWLLGQGLQPAQCDDLERTALHAAAAAGQTEACEVLLGAVEVSEELVNAEDWEGATAVHLAIASGRAEVCRCLAVKKADLQARLDFGVTPLQMAAEGGHEDVLQILLDDLGAASMVSAIAAARVSDGRGAWLVAAAEGHLNCCKRLRDAEVDVDLAALKDRAGRGAMALAAKAGKTDLCDWLLKSRACPDGLSEQDDCGWTPLHVASAEGQKAMVEWLLEAGADLAAGDEDGKTAIDWAKLRGHAAVEAVLKRADKAKTVAS